MCFILMCAETLILSYSGMFPPPPPMQDLTTGSVTRHLLKTTSFMLVTMVFQTLYFLVDLYWVGRLGQGSGRRRSASPAT